MIGWALILLAGLLVWVAVGFAVALLIAPVMSDDFWDRT